MPSLNVMRPVGLVLTLFCIAFLGKSLLELDTEQLERLSVDGVFLSVVVWTPCYVLLLFGVTTGYVYLVRSTGQHSATLSDGFVMWGRANIAKYLPGNVLHFAGRQIIGAHFGWTQSSIVAASLLEIALQVVLPVGFALLLLVAFGHLRMLEQSDELPLLAILALLVCLAVACFTFRIRARLPQRLFAPLTCLTAPQPVAVLVAACCYLSFFVGMSLIVWALYALVVGDVVIGHLPVLSAAFLLSWVMGFVLPGAPGGIGVREGTFAALGSIFLTSDALVVVAVLMRLITLLGEGVVFVLTLQLWRRGNLGQVAASYHELAMTAAVPERSKTH